MPDLALPAAPPRDVRLTVSTDERIMQGGLALAAVFLTVALVLPLALLLWRSFLDHDGAFVGLANYVTYLTTPSLASE